MPKLVEYQVRPVERYIITRFETDGPDENGRGRASCEERGEFSSPYIAREVAFSLGRIEQDSSKAETKVVYPDHPGMIVQTADGLSTGESR